MREGREAGLKEGIEEGIKEGEIKGARRLVLRQGQLRFGPPDEATRRAIEAIADLARLEGMADRLLAVSSWAELLAEPQG